MAALLWLLPLLLADAKWEGRANCRKVQRPAESWDQCQRHCASGGCSAFFDPESQTCTLQEAHPSSKCGEHVEVYVMMPLDLVGTDGKLASQERLDKIWAALETSGADGFMVDSWWGITEPEPKEYNFAAYRELVNQAKLRGFKVQVVSSFHQCGGNVGDECYILLPDFVRNTSGIWYKDAEGQETQEYISLFADTVEIAGRTPLQMYGDWFAAFAAEFAAELGDPIVEVMVGLGPCGEMRYPSYPLDRWNFPGIGQFQCYDEHALQSLRLAGGEHRLPRETGTYNSRPQDTSFFSQGYASPDGQLFLEWYSDSLKRHASDVLRSARAAFQNKLRLAAKISGLHWWYSDPSHAAEVTAGYYNTNGHNAYAEIAKVLKAAGADVFDFTCLEMRDREQPSEAASSPENLIQQSQAAAAAAGLSFAGENALQRYDQAAYDQMLSYKDQLHSLTYLRVTETLMRPVNLQRFRRFVKSMHGTDKAETAPAMNDESVQPAQRSFQAASHQAFGAREFEACAYKGSAWIVLGFWLTAILLQ
ncbi:unnamed protein product [Effrenium voratum]|nr:unnamed protein product [Effrenium voratum]